MFGLSQDARIPSILACFMGIIRQPDLEGASDSNRLQVLRRKENDRA